MFKSARIKLTGWYLLIIMVISISFSIVIYRVLTSEVDRFAKAQRHRIELKLQEGEFFPPEYRFRHFPLPSSPIMDPELVEEVKQRIIMMLLGVNGIILIVSGGLGYLLAGRTLMPIKEMIDDQNRFITDASHELRTPLTSLKSAMEVHLRDKKLSLTDAKKLITDNIEDVNKLQSLSDALLQLARYQKPNGSILFEKVLISDIAKQAIKKVELLARKKKINIETQFGNYTLEGNKYDLIDLLVILLDNAIKYSPARTLVIIKMKKTDGSIELQVQDQGIGIDEKDIPHIFDRFYRADDSRSKIAASGYGLGLSIAKKIVDFHHGEIYAQSIPNKGSTFTVRLPSKYTRIVPKLSFFS